MTKSRNRRCIDAIRTLFDQYNIEYNLIKLDIPGYAIARYELTIPRIWESMEPKYNEDTKMLEWITHKNEQILPDVNVICAKFNETYEPFETQHSYLRIYSTEPNDDQVLFRMIVKYYKNEIPFPEDIELRNRQLESQNAILKNNINRYNNEIDQYISRIQYENFMLHCEAISAETRCKNQEKLVMTRCSKIVESYRKIARELYIDSDREKEDCPVCYEAIQNNDLFITPCNHILCTKCSSKCNNACPMCRDELGVIH